MKTISELHEKMAGKFEIDLGTVHHFSDGLYAKEMHIPKGYMVGTHCHKYSHLSLLAKGSVIVRSDDTETRYDAPACIEITKHRHHSIEALDDAVWFCIHATEETDVDKVDKVLIQEK